MSGAVTAAVVGGAAYGLGATAATAVAVGLGAGTLKAQNDNAKESLENQKRAQAQNVAMAKEALDNQKRAQAENVALAKDAAKKQDEALNAANPKRADVAGILGRMRQQGPQGTGNTYLTSPQGVDMANLNLGRNTVLGA